MKIQLIIAILLLVSTGIQAQNAYNETQRATFLQKSKNQKQAAFILLGGGAVAVTLGAIIFDNNFEVLGETDDAAVVAGAVLMVGGGLSMLGSIPLFISAANNKEKSLSINGGIKIERTPTILPNQSFARNYPALSVRLSISTR
jgi:hypothetical protein